MTTITITPLEFITAIDFADKTMALVNLAESLFGAVDVAITPQRVTAATYEAAMSEFDSILAEARAQPVAYLTSEQMAEIEDERIGEEFSRSPWEW